MLEKFAIMFRYGFLEKVKNRFDELMDDESGMGTIEIVLILVVLIALVIVFKSQITSLLDSVFGQINKDAESVYKSKS